MVGHKKKIVGNSCKKEVNMYQVKMLKIFGQFFFRIEA